MKTGITLIALLLVVSACATSPRNQLSVIDKQVRRFYTTDTHILGRSMTVFDREGRAFACLATSNEEPLAPEDYPHGTTSCSFAWPSTNTQVGTLLSPIQDRIIEMKIEHNPLPGFDATATLSVLLHGQPTQLAPVLNRYFREFAGCPSNYIPVTVQYANEIPKLHRSGYVSEEVLKRLFPIDMGVEDLGEYWKSNKTQEGTGDSSPEPSE